MRLPPSPSVIANDDDDDDDDDDIMMMISSCARPHENNGLFSQIPIFST